MGICEDHLVRLSTLQRPIVNQYREGKVKSTPVRGVKQYLKPYVYKQWEGHAFGQARPRAFCIMSRLVNLRSEVKRKASRSESESE